MHSTRSTSTASCRATSPSASSMPARPAATSASAASNDGTININQVDPRHLALGTALNDQVPNPFFGLPAGQGFNVTSPTVARAQLLRPFPQFGNILMRQVTLGKNQYHAAIFKFEKRVTNGWGGRINYTYSRLRTTSSARATSSPGNNGNAQNAYDLEAEYARRHPRRAAQDRVLARSSSCRSAQGKRWAQSGVGRGRSSATGRFRRSSRSRAASRCRSR